MLLEQTLSKMRAMRLTTMATALEERMQRNDHLDLAVEDFIGLLVDDEYSSRQNRKLTRMIKRAKFKPEDACLEDIKYRPGRGFEKKDILSFSTKTWIENKQNLILTGPTGSGKTYLAEAISRQACIMGYSAQIN